MGFFSKMANSFADGITGKRLEKQLHDLTVSSLVSGGLPVSEANEMVSAWMQAIQEESKREGTDKLRRNYGNWLLKEESKTPKIRRMLNKARADGATNQDIQIWGNMHDLEKRMMVKQDDNTRVAIYVDWLKKNVPKVGDLPEGGQEKAFDDAALHVRKFCTMFGDPVDTKYTSGDDRPLPYELKIRGNRSAGGGQQRRSW